MNILEEIQNCPVEWKELWEVTIWDKNFNSVPTYKQLETDKYEYRLAKELSQMVSENGDVKILTTSPSDLWTSEYIASWEFYEKEIIAIPWGGNPVVQYYKGKFITGDNRIARVKNSSELSTKFLYYYLMNKLQIISSFYRGSGIKHPDMSKVLDLKIPVPPLEIQEKIVQILDKMTEYVTELTTELTSRKKQYSYYRDKLLSFEDEVYQVEWKTLGDIGKVSMCRRILKNQTSDDGEIPFYKIGTFGRVATSYISRELFEDYKLRFSYPKLGDILISASGTIGRTVVFNGEDSYFQDSNIVWLDHDESQVLNRYLYYFYQINPWNVSDGGTISRLYNGNIEKTRIPVPSLEIQSRIVQVLDNFDMVCHDLNIGLPKETELRQKQYEYFREKLLTFTAEGEYTDSTVQYRQDLIRLLTWVFGPIQVELGAMARYSKTRIEATKLTSENYVGVDNLLQDRNGKTVTTYLPEQGSFTGYGQGDILIGNIRPYLKKIWYANQSGGTNGDVLVIQNLFPSCLESQYLYYVLSDDRFFSYDMQYAKGSKMPRGDKAAIMQYSFILPSLSEQERIVSILDNFNTLTNSLSQGLPKEIEQRQKHYEYWREQLLNFTR